MKLRPNSRPAAAGALCALLFALSPLAAQTVRPIIVEYKEKARAKFEVVNNTLYPVNVVLEPQSFSVSADGQITFRPLDKSLRVKLSAMSLRLPPQQSRLVFYQAEADELPAWFVIYASFAGLPRQSGVNIQLELPHTVYLHRKSVLQKEQVRLHLAQFQAKAKQVLVEVENTGGDLGRVLLAEARAGNERKARGSFPLFPHSRRRVEIAWDGPRPPERLLLRFDKFTIEDQVIATRE